eukprot:2696464-Pleurochrysis_carterae.AAC.1
MVQAAMASLKAEYGESTSETDLMSSVMYPKVRCGATHDQPLTRIHVGARATMSALAQQAALRPQRSCSELCNGTSSLLPRLRVTVARQHRFSCENASLDRRRRLTMESQRCPRDNE